MTSTAASNSSDRTELEFRIYAAAGLRDGGGGQPRVPTHAGPIRVDPLPAQIPAHAWQKHSAGAGAQGPRLYSWAWFGLLADRSRFPGGCPGCMHPSRVAKDHSLANGL